MHAQEGSGVGMKGITKEDIITEVEEKDVEFIRLQFTDILGNLKNVAITASQLEKALDNKCMFKASSIDGFVGMDEAELYLKPDLSTFAIFPWRPQQGKVARLICDLCLADGTFFEGDPRFILRKAVKEAEEMGYTFEVGPECEFFLFHTDEYGVPTTLTHEQAGYFDLGPMDLGENARRDIVLNLEQMGFVVEASHHEAAPAQHEIDFKYDEALETADNIMTFKLAVKTVAKRHGLHATFMPKPKFESSGSGMHISMTLRKYGENIFADYDDPKGLSLEAYYFIGGILAHIKGMTAITNPLVNSYKRLVPGFDAPTSITWSDNRRTHLVGVPSGRGTDTRIELRCPDPSANPYLAIAVCLMAGLDGIRNRIMPPQSSELNFAALSPAEIRKSGIEQLPATLYEALNELKADDFIQIVLGERVCEKYIESKEKEWDEYKSQVTNWEIEQYLYRY